jgi:hypothetical protein
MCALVCLGILELPTKMVCSWVIPSEAICLHQNWLFASNMMAEIFPKGAWIACISICQCHSASTWAYGSGVVLSLRAIKFFNSHLNIFPLLSRQKPITALHNFSPSKLWNSIPHAENVVVVGDDVQGTQEPTIRTHGLLSVWALKFFLII